MRGAVSVQLTYVNHEGVPESANIVDYFTSVTLFRRHHMCVRSARRWIVMLGWWVVVVVVVGCIADVRGALWLRVLAVGGHRCPAVV